MISYREEYLPNTIRSIQGQTLEDWEMFIFNTNKNRKIPDIDSRIKILNVDNNNFGWYHNLASQKAQSDIMLVNSDDDINFPERAQLGYDAIQSGNDLYFASALLCDKHGKVFYYEQNDRFKAEQHRFQSIGVSLCFGAIKISTCPEWREEISSLIDYTFVTDAMENNLKIRYTGTPLGLRIQDGTLMQSKEGLDKKDKEREIIKKIYNDPLLFSKRNVVQYKYRMVDPTKKATNEVTA